MTGTPDEPQTNPPPQQPSSAAAAAAPSASSPPSDEDAKKWGTHIMGPPAIPTVHPDNQKAATWSAADHQQFFQSNHPYLQYSPVENPTNNPFEHVVNMFSSWCTTAETIARNIWHNLKMGHSVPGAAWDKVNLTAKAISEGGFESLFKHTFATEQNEKLKKTFACYLSTATGPEAWSYYKVNIPLPNIGTINPVIMGENPPEKYVQVVTIDGHDFWFMGFVSFEKATHHLLDALSNFRAAEHALPAPPEATA
ncbi:hypothetical protein Vadar_033427 [Vaccinium darrowii]|uniref:Uncharacterized protein n=1 Tax=Vaccinium darrowii TaxID=229202 RepID=A0ACB7Z0B3_9ERIC|nr:hypothetical protein Vadar_033427 [Vaccinium darrowii]